MHLLLLIIKYHKLPHIKQQLFFRVLGVGRFKRLRTTNMGGDNLVVTWVFSINFLTYIFTCLNYYYPITDLKLYVLNRWSAWHKGAHHIAWFHNLKLWFYLQGQKVREWYLLEELYQILSSMCKYPPARSGQSNVTSTLTPMGDIPSLPLMANGAHLNQRLCCLPYNFILNRTENKWSHFTAKKQSLHHLFQLSGGPGN